MQWIFVIQKQIFSVIISIIVISLEITTKSYHHDNQQTEAPVKVGHLHQQKGFRVLLKWLVLAYVKSVRKFKYSFQSYDNKY